MAKSRLVICLDNSGYEVSLERRKIYVAVPDAKAQTLGQLRVVDESGEDYLYPEEVFVEAELPQSVRRAIVMGAALIWYSRRVDPIGEAQQRPADARKATLR